MTTTTAYHVTGMTCGHCEMSIREEVAQIAGVQSVDVSHASGALIVTSESDLDDTAVPAAVEEAGYSAVRG
ncbi:heavy-metal-associated domain-containing protein [Luethyella okanaganae]|uniref:Heavy-metal-associated domain-containing protein n=1 Tax=Luethyella okanaganae TaxID=69372 RepID=A0ABW1VDS5_9MICO